jgi:Holliday junction resolvase RusA-like endonuclease
MIATTTKATSKILKFWIPGRVVPKARPRFHDGNISLPRNYRGWKNTAYLEIIRQIEERNIKELPISRAAVEMQFVGAHRGDLDNLAGSLMDILCETKIIIDDRVSCISRLVIEHQPSGTCGVWVEVKPLTYQELYLAPGD